MYDYKMKHIIITTTDELWAQAQTAGEYRQSTISEPLTKVGFIHATLPGQTMDMIQRHFPERDDILLLVVDASKVASVIKVEAPLSGRAGEYPHVYGPLNLDAVIDVVRLAKDQSGAFKTPEALRAYS